MLEQASWLAVIAAVVGIVAEMLHRGWKAKDERKAKREQAIKDRDDAWSRGDAGGVFNRHEDKSL